MQCASWLADLFKKSNTEELSPEWLLINKFIERNDNGLLCEASDKTHRIKAFLTSEAIQSFENMRDLHIRHIKGGLILCQKYSLNSFYPSSFNIYLKVALFDSPGGLSTTQNCDHLPYLETPNEIKSAMCHEVYQNFINTSASNKKRDWVLNNQEEEKILKDIEGWSEKAEFMLDDSWCATPMITLTPPSKKRRIFSSEKVSTDAPFRLPSFNSQHVSENLHSTQSCNTHLLNRHSLTENSTKVQNSTVRLSPVSTQKLFDHSNTCLIGEIQQQSSLDVFEDVQPESEHKQFVGILSTDLNKSVVTRSDTRDNLSHPEILKRNAADIQIETRQDESVISLSGSLLTNSQEDRKVSSLESSLGSPCVLDNTETVIELCSSGNSILECNAPPSSEILPKCSSFIADIDITKKNYGDNDVTKTHCSDVDFHIDHYKNNNHKEEISKKVSSDEQKIVIGDTKSSFENTLVSEIDLYLYNLKNSGDSEVANLACKSVKSCRRMSELLRSWAGLAVVNEQTHIPVRKSRAPLCNHELDPACSSCCYQIHLELLSQAEDLELASEIEKTFVF